MNQPVIIEMAGDAAGVPDGWRLVPVEATPEMCKAAVIYANGNAVYKNVTTEALKIEESIYAEVFGAMLAAAPQPPAAAAPALPSEPAPKATMFHDAGAIAQCGKCRRYTLNRRALSDRQPVCDCGEQHYWSGSFKPPGPDAQWFGPAPAAAQATPERAEAQATGAQADALTFPDTCDGKEQDAFEAWAKAERYNMELHPLHWLFLNERTYAARHGWKAGLLYAVAQMRAAQAPAAAVPPADTVPLARYREIVNMHHDLLVTMQAAVIEWQHGEGPEAALGWIANTLTGPGLLPDPDAPWGREAQAWHSANRTDKLPACFCGRPSHIGWMGQGFCSDEHYKQVRAQEPQR